MDATWPAARYEKVGPFTLREGRGGGSRVSAATVDNTDPARPDAGGIEPVQIDAAEAAMYNMDQTPLFMIRPGDAALDAQLDARGYELFDPVIAYACPVAQLTDIPLPRVTAFAIWEPLAIMREIWAAGGIGPARLAVMERAEGPKTGLLGRWDEKPGGAAFVAVHDGAAMLHALEILPHQRNKGLGKWMVRGAAFWAAENGAGTLAAVCTRANAAANALYASLGMAVVGQYHYRRDTTEKDSQ
ncbi:MAG: GNAT family N-acetyltransferase [Rhodobacteraceae bacterium]|nr:GNAT family N-acetyltransferase [Paracoccaceae bacterium]